MQSVGSDEFICAAARVSTGSEKVNDSELLLNYLMKQRHSSPFEHGLMTFYVHAPIFVWREWHRHRFMSYNEESARYKTLEPIFYIPSIDRPMMKVENWKPGRPKFTQCDDHTYHKLRDNLKEVYELAYENYIHNLSLGIDPGLARDCLPVGIYSSCYVTCNPLSLMHFLSLRTSDSGNSYPLYEIEVAAKKCEVIFSELYPITHKVYNSNGRISP